MTTVQKVSEKLTIHINRTGFYVIVSFFIAPFFLYPFFKLSSVRQKESNLNCAQLQSQIVNCEVEKNDLKVNKNNPKLVNWDQVIKKTVDEKSETIQSKTAQLYSFSYPAQLNSENKEVKFDDLKTLQGEIEKIGRYIKLLVTDSEESSSQNTQIDYLSDNEANSAKVRFFIFYGFFTFIIFSVLESKPFYEKLIFDRKSGDLTVIKFMLFWFKKNKYSLGNNCNLSIESESDDYDIPTHRLNLVLESEQKIVLYGNSDYNEVEKVLKEIRDFLNLNPM